MRKIIAKIHLKHISDNARALKSLTKTRLCAVVKANAYGHGAEEVTNALCGIADCFAVALLCEAVSIRVAACGKDILILTPPSSEEDALLAAKNGFVMTVGDFQTAKLLVNVSEKYGVRVRLHCKTNTGMNRYGMNASMLGRVCAYLSNRPLVSVEGMYSHLYGSTVESAEKQRGLFLQMQSVFRRYFPHGICHLSATLGSLLGDRFAFDMVRVGIGLYGYLPSGGALLDGAKRLRLKKGMTVYAEVAASRRYAQGGAGYGEEKPLLKKGERLTVLRCGYADGFLRNRKNGTCGFERNVNELCMDACVRKGGTAKSGEKKGALLPVMTDADETAKAAGTISYEVLCAATRRAETVYDYE